ncbi:MAG: undecaprenyl-diphosphate phosphatase [Chitinophagales bacterium]
MSIFDAIILAIVEGITEFLPISSTGHMIIASSILGIADDPFTKSFEIAIQFGAILSVVVLYWKRFFRSIGFYIKLFIAFIPAAILGFLFSDAIDSLLSNVMVVAVALIAGGFILIFIDKIFAADTREKLDDADAIKPTNAFIVGGYQCLAMIPGVSRSAATIIGGMTRKMTRKAAAEFSFFLAVPTMFAATTIKCILLF